MLKKAASDWIALMRRRDDFYPVLRLFLTACPSTIAWLVISIIVYALNGEFVGGLSHVSIEGGEEIPFLANRDSAPAVPFKMRCIWVEAPLAHPGPNSVFPDHSEMCAMFSSHSMLGNRLPMQAPATSMFSALEIAPDSERNFAAITSAFPSRFQSFGERSPNYNQAAKSFPGEV